MNEQDELETLLLTLAQKVRVLEVRLERLEERYGSHTHLDGMGQTVTQLTDCSDDPPDSRG